jgi:hypothetical protein
MIKKRSRPQTRREPSRVDKANDVTATPEGGKPAASQGSDTEEVGLPYVLYLYYREVCLCSTHSVHELIELRKLRQAREGIDASRLVTGDVKRRRKRRPEDEEQVQAGLRQGTGTGFADDEDGCVVMCGLTGRRGGSRTKGRGQRCEGPAGGALEQLHAANEHARRRQAHVRFLCYFRFPLGVSDSVVGWRTSRRT